jgi:DHA1 family inner membrane transport protein
VSDASTAGETAATDTAREGLPRRAILVLGTGLFGLGLTVGGYGAVVPVLVAGGVPADVAGAGTSAFLLGQAIAVLPGDRLTRRYAPRTVAALGLLLAAGGAALLASTTVAAVVASRSLVGLGQGAAFVAAMVHVGRLTTGDDTATAQGLLGAGFTLGFAVGLAAGPDAIERLGTAPPAVASAAVIAAGGVGALGLGRATSTRGVPSVAAYLRALRAPVAATLALGNAATFGFLVVAGTWYADLLAGTAVPATAVLIGFALATVAGRAVGGVLAARVGDATTVGWSLVGQTVVLGGTAAAVAADRPTLVAVGVVLTGLGFGVPFGPLFALAFTEIAPDPGVTLVGMLVVGNLAALGYPWLVGRALVATGTFAVGLGAMAATVGVVALVWARTVGLTRG